MSVIDIVFAETDERRLARDIGIPHDEARIKYRLTASTVKTYAEYSDVLGNYYKEHVRSCVCSGGSLLTWDAAGKAKEIVEHEYRERGGDIVTAFNDACDDTNGGLLGQIDMIAQRLKTEAMEHYIRDVFDRHCPPNSWEARLELVRAFLDRCGSYLATSVEADQPERYARDVRELVRAYVRSVQRAAAMFRRL